MIRFATRQGSFVARKGFLTRKGFYTAGQRDVLASLTCFEGEAQNQGSGAPNPDPAAPQGQPPQGQPPQGQPPQGQPAGPKSFTQEQVNALLAEDKRKLRQQNQELIQQLETLRSANNTTEEQRQELTTRIEQLQTQYQTAEEQKKSEIDKLNKKYDTELKTLTGDRDAWKRRFEQKLIHVDIAAAAVKHEACSVEQIYAMLAPKTKTVEKLGEDSKPIGEFESKVDFIGKGKEGQDVQLQLSVDEAVKKMTEMPEIYGNLFKAKGNGGLGGQPGQGQMGNGAIGDIASMTPEQYKAKRTQIRQQMAQTRG